MSVNFYTDSTHTAHINLENPTTKNWIYEVRFILGGSEVSRDTVSINANASKMHDVSVIMPTSAATLVASVAITETTTSTLLGTVNLGTVNVVAAPVPVTPAINVSLTWD